MDRAFVADFVNSVHNKPESFYNNYIDFDLSDKNDHVLSALLGDTSPVSSDSKDSLLSNRLELVASSNRDFDNKVVFECNNRCSCLAQLKKKSGFVVDKESVIFLEDSLCHKKIPWADNGVSLSNLGEGGTWASKLVFYGLTPKDKIPYYY